MSSMGIAILPEYVMEREIERGELHPLKLREIELTRPLVMFWDRRRPFSPIQRAFINLLAAEAPQLQLLL